MKKLCYHAVPQICPLRSIKAHSTPLKSAQAEQTKLKFVRVRGNGLRTRSNEQHVCAEGRDQDKSIEEAKTEVLVGQS